MRGIWLVPLAAVALLGGSVSMRPPISGGGVRSDGGATLAERGGLAAGVECGGRATRAECAGSSARAERGGLAAGVECGGRAECDGGAAVTFDEADGTSDGAGVVVGFWGWREDGPCGAQYDAAAVEAAGTVAITVRERGHDNTRICPMVGLRRTAVALLGSPLGDRIVVDASAGQVVTR